MPINGSLEAFTKLRQSEIPFRICSNTSTRTSESLAKVLVSLGFDVQPEEVFTPIPAACNFLRQHNLRPFLIVDLNVESEFSIFDQSNPNCVLLGDATSNFTYDRLNAAFQLLVRQDGTRLITMGMGKYYKEVGGIMLDCGPYAKALEFASGVSIEVVGKPSRDFFEAAIKDMKLTNQEVVMIGDDIVSDVGGAQACGLRGVLVRTGKYRREYDEPHAMVTPDGYADNLLDAVNQYLQHTKK